ncbi:MAG: hypothetical protein V4558_02340 [Gemmatimonadota bacterium]
MPRHFSRFVLTFACTLAITCHPGVAASAQEARSAAGARASVLDQLQRQYSATGIYLLHIPSMKDLADTLIALRECSAEVTTDCYAAPRKIIAIEGVRFIPSDSAVADVFIFGDEHGVDRGFTITRMALRYDGNRWRQVGEIKPTSMQHPRTPD